MIQFDDLLDFRKCVHEDLREEFDERLIKSIKEIQTQLFMFSKEFGNMLQLIGRLEDRVESLEKQLEYSNSHD